MNRFKELTVWKKAKDLAVQVYRVSADFPKVEQYGLTDQIKRSAVSIASNIAEGAGRNSKKEFYHFLGISVGSAFELETQLIIATELAFVDATISSSLLEEVRSIQNMLYKLRQSLK